MVLAAQGSLSKTWEKVTKPWKEAGRSQFQESLLISSCHVVNNNCSVTKKNTKNIPKIQKFLSKPKPYTQIDQKARTKQTNNPIQRKN